MLRPEIRVAVLADSGLVGDALAASLAARPEFVWTGLLPPEQADLPQRLAAGSPEVVVIDADAPGVHLRRLIKKVLSAVPGANVVVVGKRPDVVAGLAAVRAGAAAWSERTTSVDRLVDVMLGVHHGEAWFPPALLREMLRALTMAAEQCSELEPDGATPESAARDAEMVERVARGMSTDAIAREFGVSVETVRGSARRAMHAAGVRALSGPSSVGRACHTAGAGVPTPTD